MRRILATSGYTYDMKSVLLLALTVIPVCAVAQASEQTPKPKVTITALSAPKYPAIAIQARITGAVTVDVSVNSGGTVESVAVLSGHPILKPAALESARATRFACDHCSAVTHLVFTYEFRLGETIYCTSIGMDGNAVYEPHKPELTQSGDVVTIIERPVATCDPVGSVIKVRSAKCLFLWHCSKGYPL